MFRGVRLVPCYVIQDRDTGLFLAETLDWVRSLRNAGRLHDPQEAADTAMDQSAPGEFEIHTLWEPECSA